MYYNNNRPRFYQSSVLRLYQYDKMLAVSFIKQNQSQMFFGKGEVQNNKYTKIFRYHYASKQVLEQHKMQYLRLYYFEKSVNFVQFVKFIFNSIVCAKLTQTVVLPFINFITHQLAAAVVLRKNLLMKATNNTSNKVNQIQLPISWEILHPIEIKEFLGKKAFEKIQQHIKNDQRKLLDETYQISDPGLLCPSSNKIVYACLHKNCIQTQKCFRCQKKSCPTCSKQHQFHGNQFHIEELTKQLRLRAIEQKKLLNKLQQIEAKAINQLKTKKIIQFDKFNLKGLQEKYARIIENFYVKKSTVDIKGSLLNELTQKLIQINEKSSDYSQQLVREFQKQTFKIITTWQILENQIIQKFNAYTRSGIRKVVYTQQSPASFRKSASTFEHPNNPHNKHFKITESLTSYSITKTTTDDYQCSFVKNGVIFSNTITSFKLHFTKMNGKVVLVGIATKSVFGVKEAYTHKEAITYASSTGNIWENGDSRKGGKGIKQGQVLMLRVDTINWQVIWCIGCDELAKTSIPDSMKKQGLYMVIMILDKDGTVQYLT